MADLFKDIIPSILVTKKNALEDGEKDYVPFVVNKALSFHYDCIMPVNAMNLYHGLDNKLQYGFLLNTIRGRKRPYQKWVKREVVADVELLKEHYDYSDSKARDALKLLTEQQLAEIRALHDKGGTA